MKRASLFIVHTPFQLMMAHHIRRTVSAVIITDSYLVIDMPSHFCSIDRTIWSGIYEVSQPIGMKYIPNAKKISLAIRQINTELTLYTQIYLFLAQIHYPLSNAMFAFCLWKDRSRYTLINYPEGIVNLVPKHLTIRDHLKNTIKMLWGAIYGHPYTPFHGDMSGVKYASKIYSFIPSAPFLSAYTHKVIPISCPRIEINTKLPNSCIVLGTCNLLPESVLPHAYYTHINMDLAIYTKSLGFTTLYYKPHHHDNHANNDIFSKLGFNIIADNIPIEEYFAKNPVDCVISFNSSALIHLRLLYPNDVKCISYKGNLLSELSRWNELEKIYISVGVTIVK